MEKSLFTVRDIADHVGCSERKVWRLIASGELPVHRIGDSVRISREDRDAYLARSRQQRRVRVVPAKTRRESRAGLDANIAKSNQRPRVDPSERAAKIRARFKRAVLRRRSLKSTTK